MKIWITGARGMLGTTLCQLLEQRNIPFVGTDRTVDITSKNSLESFFDHHRDITHIINCAAYAKVDLAEKEEKQAHAINAKGIQNLGELAHQHNLFLTHFSTDYVFGGESNRPYQEESPCTPIGVYAKTKHQGEINLLEAHPSSCIIRTSWLFGLNGKNFVSTMLTLMQNQKILRIVSDQIGRPTYCLDLAEAALALLGKEGTYHFSNRGVTSWYEFALQIAKEGQRLGYPIVVDEIIPITTASYPTPAKRPAYSVLDTTKIEQILDWEPRRWQEALADYLHKTKR